MHIHPDIRKGFQNPFPHVGVDLHGSFRIILPGPSGVDLEGEVFLRILLRQVGNRGFAQPVEPFVRQLHHGADAGDPADGLQIFHGLVIIVVGKDVDINPPSGAADPEFSLAAPQGVFNLLRQRRLEQIPVFSLHADFRVFDQKCLKHNSSHFSLGQPAFFSVW